MPDEEFRPGAHDLETPFVFVPHGAPDPVEWKRQHPGWVSFPATFVPHPKPIPKWKIINGQRWPLDKKGRPWPKTRYGRPTCPFNELPPGVRAPGTQVELMRRLETPTLLFGGEGMPTVEEFSLLAARLRAEQAAAAPPPPPVQQPKAYDGDGLGPVRDYLDAMRRVDQHLREFAAAARQHDTARQVRMGAVDRAEAPDLNSVVSMRTAIAMPPNVPSSEADTPDAAEDLLTLAQSRRGGGRPTQMPGGGLRNLTPAQEILMFRFNRALETLRRLEPNNRESSFLVEPNTVPSEAWVTRLESEARQAEGRAQLGQPPRTLGMQQPVPQVTPPNRRMQALDAAIQGAINSNKEETQLEGQTARLLQEAGFSINSFQRRFFESSVIKGEVDVETSGSIIETTVSPANKPTQITRLLTSPLLNPSNKAIILYAPNYNVRAGRDIEARGAYVARTPQQLIDLVRKFGG